MIKYGTPVKVINDNFFNGLIGIVIDYRVGNPDRGDNLQHNWYFLVHNVNGNVWILQKDLEELKDMHYV